MAVKLLAGAAVGVLLAGAGGLALVVPEPVSSLERVAVASWGMRCEMDDGSLWGVLRPTGRSSFRQGWLALSITPTTAVLPGEMRAVLRVEPQLRVPFPLQPAAEWERGVGAWVTSADPGKLLGFFVSVQMPAPSVADPRIYFSVTAPREAEDWLRDSRIYVQAVFEMRPGDFEVSDTWRVTL